MRVEGSELQAGCWGVSHGEPGEQMQGSLPDHPCPSCPLPGLTQDLHAAAPKGRLQPDYTQRLFSHSPSGATLPSLYIAKLALCLNSETELKFVKSEHCIV